MLDQAFDAAKRGGALRNLDVGRGAESRGFASLDADPTMKPGPTMEFPAIA
jgi:hypothetical protein